MKKNILLIFILIAAALLRSFAEGKTAEGLLLGVGGVLVIWLFARSLEKIPNDFIFPSICAFFLAISPWHVSLVKYPQISFQVFLLLFGAYLITKYLRKNSFKIAALFLIIAIIVFNLTWESLINPKLKTEVPIWTTDEQRREHGGGFDNLAVVLVHNKVVNYTLSFMDSYLQTFEGSFLFVDGDVRDGAGGWEFGQMYLFDLLFIIVAFVIIAKSPKGWGLVLIWLLISPLPSALDFQPPSEIKAANMIVPLIILSSFGATITFKYIIKLKVKN